MASLAAFQLLLMIKDGTSSSGVWFTFSDSLCDNRAKVLIFRSWSGRRHRLACVLVDNHTSAQDVQELARSVDFGGCTLARWSEGESFFEIRKARTSLTYLRALSTVLCTCSIGQFFLNDSIVRYRDTFVVLVVSLRRASLEA